MIDAMQRRFLEIFRKRRDRKVGGEIDVNEESEFLKKNLTSDLIMKAFKKVSDMGFKAGHVEKSDFLPQKWELLCF